MKIVSAAIHIALLIACAWQWYVTTGPQTVLWLAAFYVFADKLSVDLK